MLSDDFTSGLMTPDPIEYNSLHVSRYVEDKIR